MPFCRFMKNTAYTIEKGKKMKKRFILLSCLLLTASFLLCACKPAPSTDPRDSTDMETVEPESESEQVTTQPPTEESSGQQTEPPVEVVVPDGEYPDLTAILAGKSDIMDLSTDMKGKTVSQLKAGGGLTFIVGSLFTKSAAGLTATNTGWDSVGYSKPVSSDTYTAKAQFSVAPNGRGGSFNAAMVGLYCKTSANLFIDSGLWFSFRESTAAVYVKQGIEKNITTDLPFSATDGIAFRAEGDKQGAKIYANDLLIATVEIGEQLVVKNAEGNEIASCGFDNVSVDGTGYFRYMTHYANSTLESMSLYGETKRTYQPEQHVYAFKNDLSYTFVDKAQCLTAVPTAVYSDVVYADACVLGSMFGFTVNVDDQTLTMTQGDVSLTFTASQTGVKVNEQAWAFPTTVYTKQTFMLPVAAFGKMLGYQAKTADGTTVLSASNDLEEAVIMAQERYDLYQSIVYNYDDVECDQTGVGKYEATPYEERIVGIAYTTWHSSRRNWKTGTWDTPLCGPYLSDDERVLRLHAELLRDAGVDFVFIDWSNNTNYDPATMREQRDDFRMIEEATDKMFDVWATVQGAPKICIFVGPGHQGRETIDNGNHQKKVEQVWRDYVTNPDRADMYFYYQGKPLLACYGATPTQYGSNPSKLWDDDRFTVRWITGYVGQQSNLFKSKTLVSTKYWSWEERGAQTYTVLDGRVEAVTVSASTRAQGKEGGNGYIPAAGRENGATLKKQFQRACDLGAGIVIIVSWNEWTTGEQPSPEVSKDMEPSVIHGTFYYDLMREQIKKFKGQITLQEQ